MREQTKLTRRHAKNAKNAEGAQRRQIYIEITRILSPTDRNPQTSLLAYPSIG